MNEIRRQIIEACHLLYSKGWLAACDGNVSHLLESQEIVITPGGRHKGFITEDELAMIDLENKILSGKPSTERLMHLEVYRRCPKARAVVHAHPPAAVAWSVAKPFLRELPNTSLSEVILAVGRIPIVPYARPGTAQMGTKLLPFLEEGCKVMILAKHGALAWGESLEEAYFGMERLEHAAVTLMYAKQIAGLNELPFEEVRELKRMRKQIGNKTL